METEVLVLVVLRWQACKVNKGYFVDNLLAATMTGLAGDTEEGRT